MDLTTLKKGDKVKIGGTKATIGEVIVAERSNTTRLYGHTKDKQVLVYEFASSETDRVEKI